MRYVFIILLVLFSFSGLYAAEQAVSLKANADRNKITIGDQIVYTVELKYPARLKVEIPNIASLLTSFEIKDYKIDGPKKSWGKWFSNTAM